MSSTPKSISRRRLLGKMAALSLLSTPMAFAFGKKNIRNFGEIHDYLKDGYLRVEKAGEQRITIKNADFRS
ncbi:MAG: hypothetical protein LBU11_03695 [Zoogloeaceae bacterium]|jgi:hypothetical protein|nr:hypothetical protein [Zoogloeaceae bacterium]